MESGLQEYWGTVGLQDHRGLFWFFGCVSTRLIWGGPESSEEAVRSQDLDSG